MAGCHNQGLQSFVWQQLNTKCRRTKEPCQAWESTTFLPYALVYVSTHALIFSHQPMQQVNDMSQAAVTFCDFYGHLYHLCTVQGIYMVCFSPINCWCMGVLFALFPKPSTHHRPSTPQERENLLIHRGCTKLVRCSVFMVSVVFRC